MYIANTYLVSTQRGASKTSIRPLINPSNLTHSLLMMNMRPMDRLIDKIRHILVHINDK